MKSGTKIRRILVISRMTPYFREAIHYGVSLARTFKAELLVWHLVSNPVEMMALNAPGLFPEEVYKNYLDSQHEEKEQLEQVIKQEIRDGFPIKELISDRDSLQTILEIVREEQIDLVIMLAHEEGRIEHSLFGGENDAIIRSLPCSLLLVKKEPGPVNW